MEVILRETIETLGRAGQIVKVANGYARNYLLPRKLAYPATPGNIKVIEFERQSLLRKESVQQGDAEKLKEMIEKVEQYLRAGVRYVWLVDPNTRTVQIHRWDGTVTKLHENDDILGEEALEGFRCRVGDFFQSPASMRGCEIQDYLRSH